MTVTNVAKDPENLTLIITAELTHHLSAFGSSGRILASSSAGGARQAIRRRRPRSTCAPAARSSST